MKLPCRSASRFKAVTRPASGQMTAFACVEVVLLTLSRQCKVNRRTIGRRKPAAGTSVLIGMLGSNGRHSRRKLIDELEQHFGKGD